MPGTPLFTLITVTRNAAATLARTLDSVRSQSFRDFEYLVVDGGSGDATLEMVHAPDSPVHEVVSAPPRGISDAFNVGLQRARGRLVGFINADDWYEPAALDAVAALESSAPADVYCGLQRYWSSDAPAGIFDVDPRRLPSFMSVNHMASFARRSCFQQHGGFDVRYRVAMDYELYLRFFRRGVRFTRVDAVLANMSLGGVSDREWARGLVEVHRAQRANGEGRLEAGAHVGFQLAKGAARRALQRLGAQTVVDFYRSRIARVRRGPVRR